MTTAQQIGTKLSAFKGQNRVCVIPGLTEESYPQSLFPAIQNTPLDVSMMYVTACRPSSCSVLGAALPVTCQGLLSVGPQRTRRSRDDDPAVH